MRQERSFSSCQSGGDDTRASKLFHLVLHHHFGPLILSPQSSRTPVAVAFSSAMKCFNGVLINLAGLMVIMATFHSVKGHFMAGPTCTVTSMIPGSSSVTSAMEGTCQSILACRGVGGVPIGKCGLANVCCICK